MQAKEVKKIKVKYVDSTEYTLYIDYDNYTESPEEWGGYKIHILDYNSEYLNEDGGLSKEAKKMLKNGEAFLVDKYEHGGISYSLSGEGVMANDWDNARNYAMIIFNEEYIKGTDYNTRKEYARGDLSTYSKWCNGEVYIFRLEDSRGNMIDSCSGYYSEEDIDDAIASVIPGAINIAKVYEWDS